MDIDFEISHKNLRIFTANQFGNKSHSEFFRKVHLIQSLLQVTGGNKGIGFAIVRALCKQYDGNVYLTARDVARGLNAVSELKKEGLEPMFHQLDVTNDESVTKFRDYLKNQYGGLDVLVNNAAIAFKVIKRSHHG